MQIVGEPVVGGELLAAGDLQSLKPPGSDRFLCKVRHRCTRSLRSHSLTDSLTPCVHSESSKRVQSIQHGATDAELSFSLLITMLMTTLSVRARTTTYTHVSPLVVTTATVQMVSFAPGRRGRGARREPGVAAAQERRRQRPRSQSVDDEHAGVHNEHRRRHDDLGRPQRSHGWQHRRHEPGERGHAVVRADVRGFRRGRRCGTPVRRHRRIDAHQSRRSRAQAVVLGCNWLARVRHRSIVPVALHERRRRRRR